MSPTKIPGELSVSFRYTPGVGNTAFFEALRDRGVFLGSRCDVVRRDVPAGARVLRALPGGAGTDTECGPAGELVSWTVVRVDVDDQPLDRPVTYGLVKLDGADTALLHRLVEFDGEPTIGERVSAVLAPERDGSMLDVEGFAPAG